jgi:hypothetical protein
VRATKVIIVLASFVLLLIGVIASLPGDREPAYNGKTLSEWLLYRPAYGVPSPATSNAFELQIEAIREIGEPAVPWLLKWARYQTPAWRWKLERFFGKDRRIERRDAVWFAFKVLGPKAAAAIPELTRMINKPGGPEFYGKPLNALSHMGDRGFPPVLAVLENPRHLARSTAVGIIGDTAEWGTNRLRAVPALVSCLRSDNYFLADLSESALGKIAKDPALTLPALAKSLSNPATTNIDDTIAGLTTLIVSQKNPEHLRIASTMALGIIGKPAHDAIPALVRTLNDDDQLVQSAATNALLKIAPGILTNGVKDF